MKTLTLALVLLMTSLTPAYSSDQPKFQIDQGQSKLSLDGDSSHLKGSMDIQDNFEDSQVKIKTDTDHPENGTLPAIKFISTEIVGQKDKFILTGNLTINGITKTISFDSYYLGFIKDGYGHDKAGILGKVLISAEDFGLRHTPDIIEVVIKLLGARPSEKTSAIVEMVGRISR
jgi:polyisoprenoid-binding protein YceI